MNGMEYTYHVVETFISINGEGKRAGQLALFLRFAGCNLNCEYCDTKWANEKGVAYKEYTTDALCSMIKESKVKNVTLTGGEPLIQPHMDKLLQRLRKEQDLRVEIETNGSVALKDYLLTETIVDNVSFTLDYKTAVSGMEEKMCMENYKYLRPQDTVKFVVGSIEDMQKAKEIITNYHLVEKGCGIYLSPCFGKIEPAQMVEFLIENKLNDVNVQLQLHKFIWDPEKRGV